MSRAAQYEFIPTDPDDIMTWMAAKYEEITGVTVQPGSPERLFIQWAATVVIHERILANYAANQNMPSRAEGKNLDAMGELFHTMERPEAKAATCIMRFTISKPQTFAVLVRSGTRVTDAGKTLVWETTEDVYVNAGETWADVEARCQTKGKVGNEYMAGQISAVIDPFAYFLSCTNITKTKGGEDEATDEEFYELMRLSMDGYSCAGASGGYIYFAKKADAGIADVVPITPSDCVVEIYVLMKDGSTASDEVKEKVLAACSADRVRPMTDHVFVKDPERVKYNVRLTYYTQEGTKTSGETIENSVQEAVYAFTHWQGAKLGRDINPSQLYAMLMKTGIKRVELEEPVFTVLRDGRDDKVPQVAELGSVTITNGGCENE